MQCLLCHISGIERLHLALLLGDLGDSAGPGRPRHIELALQGGRQLPRGLRGHATVMAGRGRHTGAGTVRVSV